MPAYSANLPPLSFLVSSAVFFAVSVAGSDFSASPHALGRFSAVFDPEMMLAGIRIIPAEVFDFEEVSEPVPHRENPRKGRVFFRREDDF